MARVPKPRLLGLAVNLSGAYITIDAVFSIATPMRLLWSFTEPLCEQLFRTIRGVSIPCGCLYHWFGTTCVAPDPDLVATAHHFRIPAPEPGTTISWFLANDCLAPSASFTTVPFIVLVPTCPPVSGFPLQAFAIPPPPLQGPPATIVTSILVS